MMTWQDLHHGELTVPQLYAVLKLRCAVFVVEQTCAYQDVDGDDLVGENRHLLGWRGDELVGVARSVTDYHFCCYLSDLAVDRTCQHQGIGRELVERARTLLGEEVSIILLSAPEAMDFYPRLGFEPVTNGFIVRRAR